MSSNVCSTCKNESSCTFPRNQTIIQCEEYEYAEPRTRSEATPAENESKKKIELTAAR